MYSVAEPAYTRLHVDARRRQLLDAGAELFARHSFEEISMRQIAAALPNARLVEVTAAGHMAPLERPAQVNTAIREFLRATQTPTRT